MKKLILFIALTLILILTSIASCGSDAEKLAEDEGIILSSPDIGPGMTSSGSAPGMDMDWDNGEETDVYKESETTGGRGQAVTATTTDSSFGIGEDRMIVRTGDMAMVVENVESSIDRIKQLAETYEGWLVSS